MYTTIHAVTVVFLYIHVVTSTLQIINTEFSYRTLPLIQRLAGTHTTVTILKLLKLAFLESTKTCSTSKTTESRATVDAKSNNAH